MRRAGGAVSRGERRRQTRCPPIEEGLHVGWPEAITDRLQMDRIGAGEKPVIQTVKDDAGATQLLLHPRVAVETDLDGIRPVGAERQKRRPPVGVLHVSCT